MVGNLGGPYQEPLVPDQHLKCSASTGHVTTHCSTSGCGHRQVDEAYDAVQKVGDHRFARRHKEAGVQHVQTTGPKGNVAGQVRPEVTGKRWVNGT